MTSLADISTALVDHASTLGVFDRVAGHEPDNPPGRGLTCGLLVDDFRPIPRRSGLNITSARLVFLARIYRPLGDPADADRIDPEVLDATSALVASLIGDLDLTVTDLEVEVDVFGAHGIPVAAKPGWLTPPDGPTYRVIDVTIPLVVSDLWPQAR